MITTSASNFAILDLPAPLAYRLDRRFAPDGQASRMSSRCQKFDAQVLGSYDIYAREILEGSVTTLVLSYNDQGTLGVNCSSLSMFSAFHNPFNVIPQSQRR